MAINLSLFTNADRSTSWASETTKDEAACPAANWIAAWAVMSHREEEIVPRRAVNECRDETRRLRVPYRDVSSRGGACCTPGPIGCARARRATSRRAASSGVRPFEVASTIGQTKWSREDGRSLG